MNLNREMFQWEIQNWGASVTTETSAKSREGIKNAITTRKEPTRRLILLSLNNSNADSKQLRRPIYRRKIPGQANSKQGSLGSSYSTYRPGLPAVTNLQLNRALDAS